MIKARTLALQVVAVAIVVLAGSRLVGQTEKPLPVVLPPPEQNGPRVAFPSTRPFEITLPGGERRTVNSILNVTAPMKYGDFVWNEDGVPSGPTWVRIDLAQQTLSVFRAGHEIGTAVILYGADEKPTPVGRFAVQVKRKDYRSRAYDAPMPYMLRLTDDGVAIHGSDVRWGAATHGCIGVPTDFASRLFEQIGVGGTVVILPAGPKKAPAPAVASANPQVRYS